MTEQRSGVPPAATVPVAAQPAVDVLTERVGVVLQDRPVVSLASWLTDALQALTGTGRGLQIVTGAAARLTTTLRLQLKHEQSRWVVRAEDGYYDGLSGAVLAWDGTRFAPYVNDEERLPIHPTFATPDPVAGVQLLVNARFRHDATAATVVGGPTAALTEELTGRPPAGWGTAEPAGRTWREADVTALARTRAPAPTWLAVVGRVAPDVRPLVGSLEIHRVPSGLDEDVTLSVGFGPGEEAELDAAVEALGGVVERLADRYPLGSVLAQAVVGRRDLTVAPRWAGLPGVVGLGVGNEAVAGVGLATALAPPAGRALGVGPAEAPGVYYPFGDVTGEQSWQRYAELMRHLGAPGLTDEADAADAGDTAGAAGEPEGGDR